LCTGPPLQRSRTKVALEIGEAWLFALRKSRQLIGCKEVPVPLVPCSGKPLIAFDADLCESQERAIGHQESNHLSVGRHLCVTAKEERAEWEWAELHLAHQEALPATEEQDIDLVKRCTIGAMTQRRR
jgi:hypothetical protein